jgi:hypothetical protein
MAKTTWSELSTRSRGLIITVGSLEGLLKVAALTDLARRPSSEIRGSKVRWALAVTLINSAGIAPIVYFIYGRQRHNR